MTAARRLDQSVVLQEPDEDAGQHPRHGNLRDQVRPPLLERDAGPLGGAGLLIFLLQVLVDLGHLVTAGAQIGLQLTQKWFQIVE